MKYIRVVAAVIEKNGKILIARRREGVHLAGMWEFPGGKIKKDETPRGALLREMAEEFGIEVMVGEKITSSYYSYDTKNIELIVFRAEHIAGNFHLYDHQAIRWIRPDEACTYDLAPADRPIAERLLGPHAR